MNKESDFLDQIFEYSNILPDHIALVDETQEITYLELKNKVEEAIKVIDRFSIYNQCVVLQLPRNIYFPIMVLALTKLGITFIPQDISQPSKRLNQMINIADAYGIISLSDSGNYQFERIDKSNCNQSRAWAIYFTSGTTSEPKAVEIPKENVMNTVIWEKMNSKLLLRTM